MKVRVKSKSKSKTKTKKTAKPSKKTEKIKAKKPAKKPVKKAVPEKKTKTKETVKAVKRPAAKKAEKKEEKAKKELKKIALPKKIARIPQRTLKKIEKLPPVPAVVTAKKELPAEYGENRITLMTVDPWKLFAYWEAREDTLKKTKGTLALRVYDVTGIYFDGKNANLTFDIPVYGRIGDSYIGVAPDKAFIVDIGFISKGKDFVMIARSNQVTTPALKVAKEEGALPEEIYEVGPVTGYA